MDSTNPDINENNKTENDGNPQAPKRSYVRNPKKPLTFACVTELLEEKNRELRAVQAEIDDLTVKRNELFFLESQGMGLVEMLTDPAKIKRLTDFVNK